MGLLRGREQVGKRENDSQSHDQTGQRQMEQYQKGQQREGQRQSGHHRRDQKSARERGAFRREFADALEIPRDLSLGEPVLTLTGERRAELENYRSILKYAREEILVSVRHGTLRITGKSLEIPWYTAEEMLVEGNIASVIMEKQ